MDKYSYFSIVWYELQPVVSLSVCGKALRGQHFCSGDAIRLCTVTLMPGVKRRGISLHACHTWPYNLTHKPHTHTHIHRESRLSSERSLSLTDIILTQLASGGTLELTTWAHLNKNLPGLCLSRIYLSLTFHLRFLQIDFHFSLQNNMFIVLCAVEINGVCNGTSKLTYESAKVYGARSI